MGRALDKLILLAMCVYGLAWLPFSTQTVFLVLAAVTVSCLAEVAVLPAFGRAGLILFFVLLCFLLPASVAFLPLITYDCFQMHRLLPALGTELAWFLRLAWVLPLLAGVPRLHTGAVFFYALIGVLAWLMAWHSDRQSLVLENYRVRRDELSSATQALERRNHDLEGRQELERRLATLAERSRIAREIHDNVGHLLTRSVMQVEALRVVHAGDPTLTASLGEVGQTLHQAYDTVRSSVHDLHDDAFDLGAQLATLASQTEQLPRIGPAGAAADHRLAPLRVRLDYDIDQPPPRPVAYALLAIVREALSNTLKHSDASSSQVRLTEFPGFYQLVVHDDGRLTSPPQPTGGIGLTTMMERVRGLGGVCRTHQNQGFTVFVSLPKGAMMNRTPASKF